MTRTKYECDGCLAELTAYDDLVKEQGRVYSSWNCRYCGRSVPGIVAEKLKHQK